MHRNAPRDQNMPLDGKTQVRSNLSRRAFYGNRTSPTQACKIVRRRFAPQAHQNALRDPHISPDAKTLVLANVSRRAFCGIHTGAT
jgi:hypothetical protein